MNKLRDTDWRRLADYLAGEQSPEDVVATRAWLDGDVRRHVLLDRLRAAWDEAATSQTAAAEPVDLERLVDTVRARVAAESEMPAGARSPVLDAHDGVRLHRSPNRSNGTILSGAFIRPGVPRPRRWPAVVALAAVVAVAGLLVARTRTVRHVTSVGKTVATANGQRATFTLADGSEVTLAPESRLTVASDFGRGARNVALTGEAYFVVHSVAGAPFVVHAGGAATRVLGTAFDVRYYPDDRTTDVTVVHGKVSTGMHGPPTVLTAGMIGHVRDSSVAVASTDDPERAVSWTQGRLVFKDTPVPVMLATLGRWYGYEFHLSDSTVSGYHISVSVRIDQPVEMMNTVKTILGVSMTFDGHVVTLQPMRGRAHAPPRDEPRTPRRESLGNSTSEVGK